MSAFFENHFHLLTIDVVPVSVYFPSMKVPVITIRQVSENSPEEIRAAVEDITRVTNGGIAHYFIQRRNKTIITNIRLKNEGQLPPNKKP